MFSKILAGALLAGAAVASPKVWTATLMSNGNSGVAGTARIETVGNDSLKATVNVTGAAKNSSLSWGIHSGKCTAPGAMLGGGGVYQSVMADSSGGGSATSTLKVELKANTDYAVVVHGSGAGSTAACGELKAAPSTE